VARNRPQRARTRRPQPRRGPSPVSAGGAGKPPIAEDPVAFADDDDDEPEEEDAMTAAVSAFGRGGTPQAERPRERANLLVRTVNFIQGSWAELRRVQWPDRQQVVQATGVVLGFVALTGVFLGVADLIAGKLVNAIL
jgi:preprotein translocase SecE subunit